MSCVDEMHTFPDVRLQLSVLAVWLHAQTVWLLRGAVTSHPCGQIQEEGEQMCSACMSDSCRRPHSSAVHLVCSLGSAGPWSWMPFRLTRQFINLMSPLKETGP